jgi:phosphoribosylamine--glycine ligase
MCFHAGTTQTETAITATGGRVLNITARAESLRAAREEAYSAADQVDWPEGFFRTDIGWRAL